MKSIYKVVCYDADHNDDEIYCRYFWDKKKALLEAEDLTKESDSVYVYEEDADEESGAYVPGRLLFAGEK